jgi:hypothetical protein
MSALPAQTILSNGTTLSLGTVDSVTGILTPNGAAAVSGSLTVAGTSAPFTPVAGRNFNVAVWSTAGTTAGTTLNGTIALTRSTDGTIFLPLTAAGNQIEVFTAVASESWSESQANVPYELNCSSISTGTIYYRFSQ